MTITQLTETAEKFLGSPNRILTGDKGSYLERYPKNVIAFDVNVTVGGYIVWSGDIDITDQIQDLQKLSFEVQNTVWVSHKLTDLYKNLNVRLPPPLLITEKNRIIYLEGNGKNRFIEDGIPYVKDNSFCED